MVVHTFLRCCCFSGNFLNSFFRSLDPKCLGIKSSKLQRHNLVIVGQGNFLFKKNSIRTSNSEFKYWEKFWESEYITMRSQKKCHWCLMSFIFSPLGVSVVWKLLNIPMTMFSGTPTSTINTRPSRPAPRFPGSAHFSAGSAPYGASPAPAACWWWQNGGGGSWKFVWQDQYRGQCTSTDW